MTFGAEGSIQLRPLPGALRESAAMTNAFPTTTATSTGTPLAEHFAFGANWARFLSTLDEQRIADAVRSVQTLLGRESLAGCRFLDAGSGSGLFSLAANRLGAQVTSFDLDPQSVACTQSLRTRFAADAAKWSICEGSLGDPAFLNGLGQFDIVYCWGVIHHTGNMWGCLELLHQRVAPAGTIVLAIYNDELYISKMWLGIKRIYQRLPRLLRPVYVAAIGTWLMLQRLATTSLAAALRLLTLRNPLVPFLNWARESQGRGMHGWYDLVDWVGGWPYEVARPEAVFRYLRDRGFVLQELTTSAGHGCNEFVFRRVAN